ncbi:hypothetical protein [Nostoc sp. LPT]|uniref:hypothetical protein n=2 Tax=Nostoc TaxID=1177 RepID=UPI0025F753BC|nr:hypothetical protein [Nostoc sp. LPT]
MSKLFKYMEKYPKSSKFLIWREDKDFKQLLTQSDALYEEKELHTKIPNYNVNTNKNLIKVNLKPNFKFNYKL